MEKERQRERERERKRVCEVEEREGGSEREREVERESLIGLYSPLPASLSASPVVSAHLSLHRERHLCDEDLREADRFRL